MAQISKEELAEQKETAKGVLINSYKMYEKSIADMLKRRKDAKDKDGNPIYSEKDTEKALRLIDETLKISDPISFYKRVDELCDDFIEVGLVLYVGKKKLVKRKEFEKFISDNIEI